MSGEIWWQSFHERRSEYKLLKDLDVTKSPGPDNFHPKVLHELADVIDQPLTIIFNKSFESGILPDIWKIGQITALFKKGDKKLASNYRPVSLTSVLCKTMEKLIRKKIVNHMKNNNLFSDKQFGFISGRFNCFTVIMCIRGLDEVFRWGRRARCYFYGLYESFR